MTDGTTGAGNGARFYAPFILGDVILLGAAWVIYGHSHGPWEPWEVGGFTVCVALGACLGVTPGLLRYRALLKQAETNALAGTLAQIQNLEEVAGRIAAATAQWQTAHEHAVQTVAAAKETAEKMAGERAEFCAFLEKANDAERNHLRLEVEKLRRAEGEWLQVLVRTLDHVYALYLAGVRSGQENLIGQLSSFQNACRDAARRVGLTPFAPPPGTAYDEKHHLLPGDATSVPPGACVGETLATGYTYQGQLIRLPMVQLEASDQEQQPSSDPPIPASASLTEPPEGRS